MMVSKIILIAYNVKILIIYKEIIVFYEKILILNLVRFMIFIMIIVINVI